MAEKQNKDTVKKMDFPVWEPVKGLQLSSFKSAVKGADNAPLGRGKEREGWRLLQTFKSGQNDLILSALNQGVDNLELVLESGSVNEFSSIMEGVKAEMISLHLNYASGPALVEGFQTLQSYLVKKNIDVHFVEGSLRFAAKLPFHWLAEDISEALPRFSFYYFETADLENVGGHIEQLSSIFTDLLRWIEKAPFEPEKVLKKSVFRILTGNDFLTEAAKVRAFFRIWDLILAELKADYFLPDMEISVSPKVYGEDLYYNLIRSTSAVLSAVVAGGIRIHLPFQLTDQENVPDDPNAFLSRMHANILHLMQHESQLDRVSDPLAGSYLLEDLTDRLAEKVWERVKENL